MAAQVAVLTTPQGEQMAMGLGSLTGASNLAHYPQAD